MISPEEMLARGYEAATIEKAQQNLLLNEQAQKLIEEVKLAFVNIPRPIITRSVAVGYDNEWKLSPERAAELSASDLEQQWTDLTDEDIERSQEYFTFADAKGWHFYLPAYLCHYLRQFPNCEWDAVYQACSSQSDRLDILSAPQRLCIDRFLMLCSIDKEARMAETRE